MKIIFILFLVLLCNNLKAQTVAEDAFQLDDYYRVQQLLGSNDNRSFCIKPLTLDQKDKDYIQHSPYNRIEKFDNKHPNKDAYFYTADLITQYNSKIPWGWNDGGMIPAKGLQTMVSTGFFAKWAKLSISLKPELIYAQNDSFPAFPQQFPDSIWQKYYYQVLDKIDAPERFGTKPYKKLLPGQSYIQLKLNKLAFSISTENMWWEPGIRNSIMMSNSAAGFLHGSFHTVKPVKTGIGNLEWQLIGGRLQHSGILPPDTSRGVSLNSSGISFLHKPNETRYLNAVIITWQPKWVPHLFIGFTRVIYEYDSVFKAAKGFSKWLPIAGNLFGSGTQSVLDNQDQIASVFFRWFFPARHFELYAEYARNDRATNIRDLMLELNHSAGYIVGGRKLFVLKPGTYSKRVYLDVFAEITWLPLDLSHNLRDEESFYSHYQVWDGYTQQGQYIGAGIGSGGVSRTMDICLVKGNNKIGLMLEQRVHNMDFYNQTFAGKTDNWMDYTYQVHAQKQFKQFYVTAELNYTKSNNYEWYKALPVAQRNGYGDVGNIHAQVAIQIPL